jgi:hypothetical protein
LTELRGMLYGTTENGGKLALEAVTILVGPFSK